MQKMIYTIGYGGRSWSEFKQLINKYSIKLVADVRRWPVSRRVNWACRENLEYLLTSIKVDYLWLGEYLGGYRSGGYKNYTSSREYAVGVGILEGLAESLRTGFTAIMCMEKLWFRCHRRFISDTLVKKGFRVLHILEANKVVEHRLKKDS